MPRPGGAVAGGRAAPLPEQPAAKKPSIASDTVVSISANARFRVSGPELTDANTTAIRNTIIRIPNRK